MQVQFHRFMQLPVELIQQVLAFTPTDELEALSEIKGFRFKFPDAVEKRCQKYRKNFICDLTHEQDHTTALKELRDQIRSVEGGECTLHESPINVLDELRSDKGLLRHVDSLKVTDPRPTLNLPWRVVDICMDISPSAMPEEQRIWAARKWGLEHLIPHTNSSTELHSSVDRDHRRGLIAMFNRMELMNDLGLLLATLPGLRRLQIPSGETQQVIVVGILDRLHSMPTPSGQSHKRVRVLENLETMAFERPAGSVGTFGFSYHDMPINQLISFVELVEGTRGIPRMLVGGSRSFHTGPNYQAPLQGPIAKHIRSLEFLGCTCNVQGLRSIIGEANELDALIFEPFDHLSFEADEERAEPEPASLDPLISLLTFQEQQAGPIVDFLVPGTYRAIAHSLRYLRIGPGTDLENTGVAEPNFDSQLPTANDRTQGASIVTLRHLQALKILDLSCHALRPLQLRERLEERLGRMLPPSLEQLKLEDIPDLTTAVILARVLRGIGESGLSYRV